MTVARATAIPVCTGFVDAAFAGTSNGTAAAPHKTIAAAVGPAASGAIICVAAGTYAETITPGVKFFTLAGGFQSGKDFKVRDSSLYVSKAQGAGTGSFVRITDPGPTAGQLTAIDGFEITGYARGVFRDVFYEQRFDLTNNNIHDNVCTGVGSGGGFYFNNVSGTISGNVFSKNTCGRGGAGATDDSTATSVITVANNLVDSNTGTEAGTSHGGGFYLFGKTLTVTANLFTKNTTTGWGGGLFVGADTNGGQSTTAALAWNVYRDNRAGIYGGGLFCDDSAKCASDHEVFDKNCGGNVYLDNGPDGAGPTVASFDHMTNYGALTVGCAAPGPGVEITKNNSASDVFTFTNSIFWGNAKDLDFNVSCGSGCATVSISVTYSNVQTKYANGGMGLAINFGAGNTPGVDPLFAAPDAHDFHLKSKRGHWAPMAYGIDTADSPALAVGDPAAAVPNNPARAGTRTELGAYGNTSEASLVR